MTSEAANSPPGGDAEDRKSAGVRPGVPPGLTKRAVGGMLWTFSGTGVQAVVQLLVLMALGRLLTPAEFGVMGAAVVVIAVSQIVSHVGVGPAIVQRLQLEVTHVRVASTISVILGLVLGAGVWLAAPALAAFYRIPAVEPVLRGVAFLFPMDGLNTVGKSLLTRQLRFRLFVALDAGSYILGYACIGVFLAWQGYGVWAMVVGNLSQSMLRTIAMYAATRHPLRPSLNFRASRDLLSFGFGHSLAQIALVFSQQADNLVVGRWLGPAALGIYGRAYNLMVMPATAFGKIVNRVLFPVMAQVQGELDRLAGAYERTLAIVALISLPVSALLWVVAPELIPAILGPQWAGVVLPFRLFTCGLFFRMSSKVTDACVKASGAVYSRALIQGLYAVMVLVAALVGQRWGVGGVAVAVSIAMGINWLMMAALGRSVTGLSWSRFLRAQAPGVGFAVLIGGAVAVTVQATRAAHLSGIPILIVGGLTAAALLVGVWRFGGGPLLGPHGTWAFQHANELIRRRSHSLAPSAVASDGLASAGKANPQ
jgi:O-antigen/teichoic acid export membrane protein